MHLKSPLSSLPPYGADCGDADGWRLTVVKAADGGLEELLDELRSHGGCEAAGGPQSSAEEEWGCSCKHETEQHLCILTNFMNELRQKKVKLLEKKNMLKINLKNNHNLRLIFQSLFKLN